MAECESAKCEDATAAIGGSITADAGLFACDVMGLLYEGDANGDFYKGYRDQMNSRSGYLLTLLNAGVTVSSANLSLKYNSTTAW